jgi:hypothetical protein
LKKLLVVVTCLAFFGVSPLGAVASSGPPPIPSCVPGAGPCQETDHFSDLTFVGSPLPGCTTVTHAVLIDTEGGNGVQHINVNGAQDFWETMTLVGPTTIVQGTAQFDAMNNYIPGTFVADLSLPTFSGQFQQWFGLEANKSNFSATGTSNFHGTSSTGASATLHFNLHFNSTGAAPFVPNVSSMHFDVSCS